MRGVVDEIKFDQNFCPSPGQIFAQKFDKNGKKHRP